MWSKKQTWKALALLRCFMACYGSGYIHPDEYFQNGEIAAGDIFGLHVLRTWEWSSELPCRSAIPPFLTTGAAFKVLSLLLDGALPHPRLLFIAERTTFLLLSFVLDYCVYRLFPPSSQRGTALLLLASSYVLHTFAVRPFSNTVEAILLALSLVLSHGFTIGVAARQQSLALLAAVFVLGVFARLTFVAFALPLAFSILAWTILSARMNDRGSSLLQDVQVPLLVATSVALNCALIDSVYFDTGLFSLVLTPLNFLRYNLSAENLAEHGLHPRWLHITVNLPMIVGPGLLFYAGWTAFDEFRRSATGKRLAPGAVGLTSKKLSIYTIVSALCILSLQPHQEPRFLLPLLVPAILIAASGGRIEGSGKPFWATWVISNVLFGVLFGVLHQGGVVPSLFYLHDEIAVIRANTSSITPAPRIHIVYWKTYMPPRHLLAIPETDVASGVVSIIDLAGAPLNTLNDALCPPQASDSDGTTFLITPFYSAHETGEAGRVCLVLRKRVFPHLDLDHIAESLALGWRDGLSLGIYVVDSECLRRKQNGGGGGGG